jgi:hypothetical protein
MVDFELHLDRLRAAGQLELSADIVVVLYGTRTLSYSSSHKALAYSYRALVTQLSSFRNQHGICLCKRKPAVRRQHRKVVARQIIRRSLPRHQHQRHTPCIT